MCIFRTLGVLWVICFFFSFWKKTSLHVTHTHLVSALVQYGNYNKAQLPRAIILFEGEVHQFWALYTGLKLKALTTVLFGQFFLEGRASEYLNQLVCTYYSTFFYLIFYKRSSRLQRSGKFLTHIYYQSVMEVQIWDHWSASQGLTLLLFVLLKLLLS